MTPSQFPNPSFLVAAFTTVLLAGSPLEAATKCVNGLTGNDGTNYAVNDGTASCWQTIHRAVKGATFGGGTNTREAVQAGDIVLIACGLYEADASDTAFYVALNPVNEGTTSNPIRFQAVDNQAACIRVKPRRGTGRGGSPIGSSDRDHIEWAGFLLSETDWPWVEGSGYQNGLVLFAGSPATVGGVIELSTLTGSAVPGRSGDNYTGIRIHGAQVTIRNNTVQDFGLSGHNNSCTTWYFGTSIVVEHNVFRRCGAAIYAKNNSNLDARTSQHIIRYNYLAPNSTGVYCLQNCNGTALLPILIYQNIIIGGDANAITIMGLGHAQDPSHVHVVNNTIYGKGSACFAVGPQRPAAGHKFYNNICDSTPTGILATSGAGAHDIATTIVGSEHAVYHRVSTIANWAGIGTINLATWTTRYGQDAEKPAAIITAPRFVAAGTNFHLQAGSPALTQGRVIDRIGGLDGATIPAGAYITGAECIGLESACGNATPQSRGGAARRPSGKENN